MFLDNERIMTYEEILENHEKYGLNINSVNVIIYEIVQGLIYELVQERMQEIIQETIQEIIYEIIQ